MTDDRDADVLARAFAPIDRVAFGLASALVAGAGLALATAVLLLKDPVNETTGQTLSLLGHFLPGYRVSWPGVAIGLAWGGLIGFAAGWLFAALKNGIVLLSLRQVRLRAEREAGDGHFLDGV